MIESTTETVAEAPQELVDELVAIPFGDLVKKWNRVVWWLGIRPMFRRMVELDLTLSESIVLRSLQRGPLTIAEAAECLSLSHSAASRAVDRLVREGLIRREENPEDRRQKQLTLTPEGATLSGEMETVFTDRLRPLLGVLDPAEQEQLRRLLARMLAAHLALPDEENGAPHPSHCPRRGLPRSVHGEAEEN